MRVLILIPLWAALALGESIEETPQRPTPPSQVVDLDFSDDFPTPARKVRKRRPVAVAKSAPPPTAAPASRSWVYWTLGFSAMAGGVAMYLHWDMTKTQVPTRNDQVFTDDPG